MVPPCGRRPGRSQPAKLSLAIEGMLDRVACGVVFGHDSGTATLQCRSQERQPATMAGTELLQRLQEAAQGERHCCPPRGDESVAVRESSIIPETGLECIERVA